MNKKIIKQIAGWLIMLNIFPVLFSLTTWQDTPFGVHPYIAGLIVDAGIAALMSVLFLAAYLINAE